MSQIRSAVLLVCSGSPTLVASLIVCAWLTSANTCFAEPRPDYVSRGDAVESMSREYDTALHHFYEALARTVRAKAPSLSAKLQAAPPRPYVYGYGLLPKVLAYEAAPTLPVLPRSSRYSWPWTERSWLEPW